MVCYPSHGGSGVIATELGQALAERGHQVHFITYELPFRLRLEQPNIFFHQVEMVHYDLFRYPDYALTLAVKMAEVARIHNLDLFHVHYAIPHATSALLAKNLLRTRYPAVITTLHGTDVTLVGRDPAYHEAVKFSIEQSCGVTAVSRDLKKQTAKLFGSKKEVQVIHNFFSPRPMKKKSHPTKLIVHASNFRPLKRIPDVIHIFEKVHQKIACRLALVGGGPGLEEARELVASKGLGKAVLFYGPSLRADEVVANADLFLLPSSQESFGLAALEAMAYGVPVIASKVGGLPEVVQDGITGYLAPCGDLNAMAAHALEILTQPELAQRLGEAGKKRAEKLFSTAKIVPQYEAYYEKILRESS